MKKLTRIAQILLASAVLAASAAGNPLTFVDCNLLADINPSAQATPGTAGGFSSPNLVGSASLRNESDQPLIVKRAVVHVLDGYGKPLFDIGPLSVPNIPPHKTASVTLSHYYAGAVTAFLFNGEFTVANPNGPDTTLNLAPQSQASVPKASPGKVPGY